MDSDPAKLADVNDIPDEGGLVVKTDDGREIALFRCADQICAIDNLCPHQGGPLSEGILEDGCVTCPWHGWQFDVKSGACQNMPSEDVRSYPISIKDGGIYLQI